MNDAQRPVAGAAQRLFVGGDWIEPDGGHYEVVDPATEGTVGLAPEASPDQVREACAAAREALGPWSRTPPEERAAVLARAADLIRGRLVPYAELAQAERSPDGAALFRRFAAACPVGVRSRLGLSGGYRGAFQCQRVNLVQLAQAGT